MIFEHFDEPEPESVFGPPIPSRHDSPDPVLREFWAAADLDLTALTRLDPKIHLAGEWRHDFLPRFENWNTQIYEERIHDDSRSVAMQIVRVDLASEAIDVVLTLQTSPVDFPWIEVAEPRILWGLPYAPERTRTPEGEARISTRTPSRTNDVIDAILRLRTRRRSKFFTCRLCGRRQPPEDRCLDSVGHCCCYRTGIIH